MVIPLEYFCDKINWFGSPEISILYYWVIKILWFGFLKKPYGNIPVPFLGVHSILACKLHGIQNMSGPCIIGSQNEFYPLLRVSDFWLENRLEPVNIHCARFDIIWRRSSYVNAIVLPGDRHYLHETISADPWFNIRIKPRLLAYQWCEQPPVPVYLCTGRFYYIIPLRYLTGI